jgi:hypothetical protein
MLILPYPYFLLPAGAPPSIVSHAMAGPVLVNPRQTSVRPTPPRQLATNLLGRTSATDFLYVGTVERAATRLQHEPTAFNLRSRVSQTGMTMGRV